MQYRFRVLAGQLVLAASVFLANPASAGQVAEESLAIDLPVDGGTTLLVENLVGSIDVTGGGKPGTASVRARVVAEAENPDEAKALAKSVSIDRDPQGGTSRVHVVFPKGHEAFFPPREADQPARTIAGWGDALAALLSETKVTYDGEEVRIGRVRGALGLAVHLSITVPDGISSTLDLRAGAVRIARLRGRTRAEVVNGRLLAEQVYGVLELDGNRADGTLRTFKGTRLRADASAGDLSLTDVDADAVELSSGSGNVEVSRLSAKSFSAETGTGELFLNGVGSESYDVSTGSGDLTVVTNLDRKASGTWRTSSGDVLVRVGSHAPFRLEIATGTGGIRADGRSLKVTKQGPHAAVVERGAGGSEIRIETGSGDVRVAER